MTDVRFTARLLAKAMLAAGLISASGLSMIAGSMIAPAQAQLFRENDQACGHTVTAPQILATELVREGKVQKISEDPIMVTLAQPESNRIWLFTKPGHAAHPSVVCRRVNRTQDGVAVESERVCKANRAACLAFGTEIKAQDEAIRRAGPAT
jgi:hypothetical protein